MKMNFEYFQIQKWILEPVRAEKVDWVIFLVSLFSSWLMVLKLSKKYIFCNFVLTARNLGLLNQLTYMHMKGLFTQFQKIVLFRVWSRRILLRICWVSIFFDILIANISWTIVQTTINHVIFSKRVKRTFRCIYVSCINIFRFAAAVSTKLQKIHSFGQLKDHKSEGNMITKQVTPFFSSTFSAITVCNIHFFYLKIVKIHFQVVSHLVHSGL